MTNHITTLAVSLKTAIVASMLFSAVRSALAAYRQKSTVSLPSPGPWVGLNSFRSARTPNASKSTVPLPSAAPQAHPGSDTFVPPWQWRLTPEEFLDRWERQ